MNYTCVKQNIYNRAMNGASLRFSFYLHITFRKKIFCKICMKKSKLEFKPFRLL